jgi:hypothetical protein
VILDAEGKPASVQIDSVECDHGVTFDEGEARKILSRASTPTSIAEWVVGPVDATSEVRRRWPRLMGPCPKGCGFNGIAYASWAHYTMGDW